MLMGSDQHYPFIFECHPAVDCTDIALGFFVDERDTWSYCWWSRDMNHDETALVDLTLSGKLRVIARIKYVNTSIEEGDFTEGHCDSMYPLEDE